MFANLTRISDCGGKDMANACSPAGIKAVLAWCRGKSNGHSPDTKWRSQCPEIGGRRRNIKRSRELIRPN
jgi:hypothetical protein